MFHLHNSIEVHPLVSLKDSIHNATRRYVFAALRLHEEIGELVDRRSREPFKIGNSLLDPKLEATFGTLPSK